MRGLATEKGEKGTNPKRVCELAPKLGQESEASHATDFSCKMHSCCVNFCTLKGLWTLAVYCWCSKVFSELTPFSALKQSVQFGPEGSLQWTGPNWINMWGAKLMQLQLVPLPYPTRIFTDGKERPPPPPPTPKLPPPSPYFGQLVPLFRTSKTMFCAYDRKFTNDDNDDNLDDNDDKITKKLVDFE